MSEPVLALDGVEKIYNRGRPNEVSVLRGASLALAPREVVALVAPSGAGKSTLLHIAGLLDTPDAGTVSIAGADMTRASDRARTGVRREKVGFVYQFHHLLPEFTALENVVLPQLANGAGLGAARAHAARLLDAVGIGARAEHRPARRRADRQPRPRHRRHGVRRADGAGARDRALGADRDPQPRAGRPHGPDVASRQGTCTLAT